MTDPDSAHEFIVDSGERVTVESEREERGVYCRERFRGCINSKRRSTGIRRRWRLFRVGGGSLGKGWIEGSTIRSHRGLWKRVRKRPISTLYSSYGERMGEREGSTATVDNK